MYLLYINDISSVVIARAKIFANDVTLYATIQSSEDRFYKLIWTPFHIGVTFGR